MTFDAFATEQFANVRRHELAEQAEEYRLGQQARARRRIRTIRPARPALDTAAC